MERSLPFPTLWLWEGDTSLTLCPGGEPLFPFPSFPKGASPAGCRRFPELCWKPPWPQSYGGWRAVPGYPWRWLHGGMVCGMQTRDIG